MWPRRVRIRLHPQPIFHVYDPLFSSVGFRFCIFIVNAIPAIILNVCPRFVRKPVRVTLSRGRQCSVERFLRVAAIGLRSLVSER